MAALGLDTLVVLHRPNVAWLTGFAGSAGAALVTPAGVRLVTDRRYETVARDLSDRSGGLIETTVVEQTYDETLVALIAASGGPGVNSAANPAAFVAFEAAALTVARFRWWEAALGAQGWPAEGLRPVADLIGACRVVKDAWEREVLAEAAARLSAVAIGVLADLEPGAREVDVAIRIETGLRRAGFSGPAFDTIVAAGARSALPHARASDRAIAVGELVLLDFGGVYGGYCVDLSRTVALGDPGPEPVRMHAAVARAQKAAIAAVAPGVRAEAIDRAARDVLGEAGLAGAFTHATGHGLGLEVHEAPRLGPPRPDAAHRPRAAAGQEELPDELASGMVFTVEPGAYVSGLGGVRIEDDVLVTDTGVQVLTSVPADLILG